MLSDDRAVSLSIETDETFIRSLVTAADDKTTSLLESVSGSIRYLPHRLLASRVKLMLCCFRESTSQYYQCARVLHLAQRHLDELSLQQGASGLFIGGDNVDSPPDSAFSLNDLADAERLSSNLGSTLPEVDLLQAHLRRIIDAATSALLTGGVHTPNHRWEISAALARFHRNQPDPALRARIHQWLAEGIDIDADGFYSERSPNYAAYVSNPALIAIADVLEVPELHDLVERNLSTTLDLIRPDGSVETIQSRRQDQNGPYPLAPFLMAYRRFAIERDRPDFAWAATLALREGIADPETLLAEVLLHPHLANAMPEPRPPANRRSTVASHVSLASDTSPTRTLITYGGSDYPTFRTIRSGLANNPTFTRLFAGEAILDSIRLSRDFFGLGPFRAEGLHVVHEAGEAKRYRLSETVSASYFQPIPAHLRSPTGTYALTDDGRFSASMAFGERDVDTVTLVTTVVVEPTEMGAELQFTFEGPDVGWALELTFVPGGVVEGVEPIDPTSGHLVSGTGHYRVGADTIRFGPGNGASPDTLPLYRPGEDYTFLGGTDASEGQRVYITGRAPGTYLLRLEADRG